MKFPTWPHKRERDLAASRKFLCSHPVEEFFFSFFIMSLYSMLVRILDEALSVCYSKRKKQVKLRAGGFDFGKRKSPF